MNNDQLIVLEHLKQKRVRMTGLLTMIKFSDDHFSSNLPEKVKQAYKRLDEKQDFEILQAFAEWGLRKEDD